MKYWTTLRVGAALIITLAVIAAALTGSAGTGHAAPGLTLAFEPLIGTSSVNEIPKVSYGRGIGFHLFLQNAGTNSTPQTSSVTVTSASATFDTSTATFNGTTIRCSANPSNNKQMVCPLPTGKLLPGDTFEAFLRFIAPTSTAIKQVSTTAALSTTAQSVGGKNNNGSTLASGTLLTDLVTGATIDNAYIRHDEKASTAGNLTASDPQNFSLTAPTGLLNNAFGVAVGIQDKLGTTANPCVGRINACTILTVPKAKFAESVPGTPFPGNPFYDGIVTHPYTWSMDALYTGGFKLTGVVHIDDNGAVQQLKDCASIGGPSPAEPLCVNLADLLQSNNPKTVHASGQGIENGNLGWN
jgi:hypothetical protein